MNKYCTILLLAILITIPWSLIAQYTISGSILTPDGYLEGIEIFTDCTGSIYTSDKVGGYEINDVPAGDCILTVFSYDYESMVITLDLSRDTIINIELTPISRALSAVEISAKREELFALRRLRAVESTEIYAGKKTEVVLLDQAVAALSSNTARQIYAQVVGLNIYENNDAGIQLNIGGRGLDPNRTSNFNTRQNGYDISADVLGYPESYYTPTAEALSQIQLIRGAASLQYGTQFGGLVNFIIKKPNRKKRIEWTSRQSTGSYGLFTSFNSVSGQIGKIGYYTYYNHKSGDGYRSNSGFNSNNAYIYMDYTHSKRTKLSLEYTYLDYLAQQAGGLTDELFVIDPRQSLRSRNWFAVDWNLYSAKLSHEFSDDTRMSINAFGLDASRSAVGFRGDPINLNSNPITEIDEQSPLGEYVQPRDVITGDFHNWGVEARFLKSYKFRNSKNVLLLGTKYYTSQNSAIQGPGTTDDNADFSIISDLYPDYANQSAFLFPNRNLAFFVEHIFQITNKLAITPGLRWENIKTASDGQYQRVVYDNAGNAIDNVMLRDDRQFARSFLLSGVGLSYKMSETEIYANFSQNYRSVTFSDIRVVSPTFIIDPDISDERGYTTDIGFRGRLSRSLSFDGNVFLVNYQNRIGIVLDNRANRVRKNIGNAIIYGVESFVDWNIWRSIYPNQQNRSLSIFVNAALTGSQYIRSEENNVVGNEVEFIPDINLKTGIRAGINNLQIALQYSYLSEQYTDSQNSEIAPVGDNRSGIVGIIPSYHIVDLSSSYQWKSIKIEAGILNLFDQRYFTRRATGYPGPGIIPSDGRSGYITLQFQLST